jgi:hypothetical protein
VKISYHKIRNGRDPNPFGKVDTFGILILNSSSIFLDLASANHFVAYHCFSCDFFI